MPLQIVRNDITKMKVDAIVNAANSSLLGGGGVDGAIHRAAGPRLLAKCITLGGCKTGDAKITSGYKLPCKYVIHTVGPVWHGGDKGEKELLESCYRRSLSLAKENGCESVAFPLISSGVYGYPKDKALKVAVDVISEFLLENEMTVYIVVFDKKAYTIGEKLFADIAEYIDDRYAEEHSDCYSRRLSDMDSMPYMGSTVHRAPKMSAPTMASEVCYDSIEDDFCGSYSPVDLNEKLKELDESFSEMLLRMIDEKGMTDAECYKKANIDRKLFSKIRSNASYKPSKPTVIAFAIALGLTLAETEEMLKKAGFALSHSNKFDIIVEYFILKGNYNIHEINEALFAFDQSLLGV
ncbi:MAG: O-acetyl-ADP-ribose deacetylase [Ruminococcaceae bacterium]|nr:O-acetyl-ADP-ribose deacetylase [Oscillospiraceae bacterium]